MPYLEQFGLGSAVTRPPRADTVPAFFNKNAAPIWKLAAETARKVSTAGASPHMLWKLTTRLFVHLCEEHNVDPYTPKSSSTNTRVMAHLAAERRKVVRFLEKTKLLRDCKIRKGKKSVSIRNGKFSITVDARVAFTRNIDDVVARHFRFRRRAKSYVSQLSKYTTVSIYNESAGMAHRWHLAYTIICDELPIIKAKPILSRSEMERLILLVMWKQVALYNRTSLIQV